MDVTRSVKALKAISSGLRILAWVMFIVFAAAAGPVAKVLAFIPVVGDSSSQVASAAEKILPFSGLLGGLVLLILGATTLLSLLALAEGVQVLVGIEANTRQAAEAAASKPAKGAEAAAAKR